MREDREAVIQSFLAAYPKPRRPIERAEIQVIVTLARRQRLDPDNFAARCKGFFDGLVTKGIIKDDSFQVLEKVSYDFIVNRELGPRVELIITEL